MTKTANYFFPSPPFKKFCTQCGKRLTRMIPPLDNRERDCCTHCGAVHYSNPLIVVGTVPFYEDKVLLCKRAIEPQYGKWTLPAGFMESEESTYEGALRETDEEAGAHVELGPLFTLVDIPNVSQLHLYYLAQLIDLNFLPGEESLDVKLFPLTNIPWEEISFTSVSATLKKYINEYPSQHFTTHCITL